MMIDYINYIIVYIYIILILSTLYRYVLIVPCFNTSMFLNIQVAVSSTKHMHTVGWNWKGWGDKMMVYSSKFELYSMSIKDQEI